ncbi:MAG: DNA translocase FtsK 4TM domain-containing protein, partial [Clostridia bacterium]|nr:DNA translocase FtsK 4TM domain-containing protein [Clostridia bacterium]
MPEQKKKKSNGTRASSRSNSKSRAKTKPVKEQSSWEMSVSGIAAAVMVASALLFLLDIFGVDAVLIGAYANLMKGLLGVGYFVLPFCLLWCAWELVVTSDQHRRKSQWISLLLFPMLIGAWGHLFTVFQSAYVDGNIGKLYADGTKLKAGGILAGLVADGISYLISPYGLAVLLLICTFIMAVYMVKLRLRDVVGHLFDTVRDKSSWREDRRAVREEERRAEWEETRRKRQEEWEKKQEYAPVPAESNPVNPSDFNLPLDKERPRPKGVFKNHEEPAEEPGGEFPFPMAPEEEPIPVEFQVDPTTGEV